MTSIKSFRQYLSDRLVINNPNDDKKFGMNDKEKRRQKSLTLYGSRTRNTKITNYPNLQTFPDEREKFPQNFFRQKG